MHHPSLEPYIQQILSVENTPPAMMDTEAILFCLSTYLKRDISGFDEVRESDASHIFLYDIPSEKKELDIATIRQCIRDISMMPYEGKNIYILRNFDTATVSAQNALLKALEDCPSYAIILLEVENPRSILDTITSRVINLCYSVSENFLSTEGKQIQEAWKQQDMTQVFSILYSWKCSREEAIILLKNLSKSLSGEALTASIDAIEMLYTTYENPRNILDIFFLQRK